MQRRIFLKQSGAALAATSTFPSIIFGKKKKPYKTVLIGTGWWGNNILGVAMEEGPVKVVGLCDVDRKHLNETYKRVEELSGDKPKLYTDYRECLEKEKPDIAIIGTPDHWHPLQTIKALEVGAHVYVEKPICHTIQEGLAMIEAQERYGGVVQVGLHRHVAPHNVEGMEFIKAGNVGKIHLAKAFILYSTANPRNTQNQEAPDYLDWDMYVGPAPMRPFNPAIHPKGFRNFMEFANGTVGDWGVHWFDQILWWSDDKHPKKIYSTADRLFDDATDAPHIQSATYEFEDFTVLWENRRLGGHENEKHNIGVYFYGEKGVFHMGWLDGWTFYPNDENKQIVHREHTLHMPDYQNIKELWKDMILAIETGQQPAADIRNSHYATNMSLLAVLAAKAGREIYWDGEKQTIVGDPEAEAMLRREYRGEWEYPY